MTRPKPSMALHRHEPDPPMLKAEDPETLRAAIAEHKARRPDWRDIPARTKWAQDAETLENRLELAERLQESRVLRPRLPQTGRKNPSTDAA